MPLCSSQLVAGMVLVQLAVAVLIDEFSREQDASETVSHKIWMNCGGDWAILPSIALLSAEFTCCILQCRYLASHTSCARLSCSRCSSLFATSTAVGTSRSGYAGLWCGQVLCETINSCLDSFSWIVYSHCDAWMQLAVHLHFPFRLKIIRNFLTNIRTHVWQDL